MRDSALYLLFLGAGHLRGGVALGLEHQLHGLARGSSFGVQNGASPIQGGLLPFVQRLYDRTGLECFKMIISATPRRISGINLMADGLGRRQRLRENKETKDFWGAYSLF